MAEDLDEPSLDAAIAAGYALLQEKAAAPDSLDAGSVDGIEIWLERSLLYVTKT